MCVQTFISEVEIFMRNKFFIKMVLALRWIHSFWSGAFTAWDDGVLLHCRAYDSVEMGGNRFSPSPYLSPPLLSLPPFPSPPLPYHSCCTNQNRVTHQVIFIETVKNKVAVFLNQRGLGTTNFITWNIWFHDQRSLGNAVGLLFSPQTHCLTVKHVFVLQDSLGL